MSRVDRVLGLLRVLRDGRVHKADHLARRFGVSARTVQRDAATLARHGIPVRSETGVGYWLRRETDLPSLTQDELPKARGPQPWLVVIAVPETLRGLVTEGQHPGWISDEESDDGVIARYLVGDLDQFVPWVVSRGAGVRVLEPAELVERVTRADQAR